MQDSETASEKAAPLEQFLTEPRRSAPMDELHTMAVEKHCETVLTTRGGGLQNPVTDEKVWRACAREAKDAIVRWNV